MRRALVGTPLVLAAGLAWAACGTGSILEEGAAGADGTVVGPDGHLIDAPEVAMVAEGGATAPNKVIKGGLAVSACDPSVQGVADTPLRRLTNLEYDNTVRDVFGIDPTPKISADFPRDGEAGPFASNAKGQITEMYLNRYQQASERIGKEVATKVDTMLPCAANGDDACAQMFIRQYGKKAFRRTLDDQQVAALMTVYTAGKADATFRDGIEYTVQAMLLSPSFMYHLESKTGSGASVPLSSAELAERLSYFIWGTIPDDALFTAAESGKLDTSEGIRAEAKRMLANPKSASQIETFADSWLHLHQAIDQVLDPIPRYADFSPDYATALVHEARKFVGYILGDKGDGKFETLMTSNKSFPEGIGFKAYNMSGPPAGYDGSQPMEVPGKRAGLITMPASMAAHSSRATSPIKRGVFVLNDILCKRIELPANAMVKAPEFMQGRSIRQGLEDVTKQEACAGCHGKINPIGFALEGYDRMGRERNQDEFDAPIDDKGILMIGDPTVDGELQGGPALSDKVFKSDSGRNCMIQQVFRFALAREEVPADTCSFVTMAQNFEKSGFNVKQLIEDMVTESSFRVHPGS